MAVQGLWIWKQNVKREKEREKMLGRATEKTKIQFFEVTHVFQRTEVGTGFALASHMSTVLVRPIYQLLSYPDIDTSGATVGGHMNCTLEQEQQKNLWRHSGACQWETYKEQPASSWSFLAFLGSCAPPRSWCLSRCHLVLEPCDTRWIQSRCCRSQPFSWSFHYLWPWSPRISWQRGVRLQTHTWPLWFSPCLPLQTRWTPSSRVWLMT